MVEHQVLLRFMLVVAFLLKRGICEETYVFRFHEEFSDCDNFENEIFKGDNMGLGKSSDDGEDSTYLEGYLELCDAIKEGVLIDIEVFRETEVGSEPMWSRAMDFCDCLDDEDAPWAGAMKMMNITGCPIEMGKYHCEKFFLDMTFAEDFLKHDWEGYYGVMIKLLDNQKNTLSCHELGMAILPEKNRK